MRNKFVKILRYAVATENTVSVSSRSLFNQSQRQYWTLNSSRRSELEERTAIIQSQVDTLPPRFIMEQEPDFLGNSAERTVVAHRQLMHHVLKLACGLQYYTQGAWTGYERIRMANELNLGFKAIEEMLPREIAPVDLGELAPLDALRHSMKEQNPELQLAVAKALILQGASVMGDLPLVEMDDTGRSIFNESLQSLHKARQSSQQQVKKQHVAHVCKHILPKLWNDVAYFQAISFLISYVHIDFECRLPFTPKTFLLLEAQHSEQVRATKYLALKHTIMQTGGQYAGIRMRLFEGQKEDGSPSGLYLTDSMGTNSDGPNRDVVMKALGISTGSGADADPRGIAYTAYQDAKPELAKMVLSIPKDAVIVNTGHSLGTTTATRGYLLQKELGYENAYLCGFNGGALDDDVSLPIQVDAQRRVMLNFAEGDPVPFGGSHVLPGVMRNYKLNPIGGTIATGQWNPLYGEKTDIIHHGTPNELASVLVGIPPSCSVRLEPQLKKGFARLLNDLFNYVMPSVRGWVIQKALKPDPTERAKVKPEFIVNKFKGTRDPNE